ncbi:sucrase ferredoxin [Nocardioides mangrovicus]|uniref:sucrase ferredoxin n=1 Tax=Nocardioides mangrovicus TaxID=2478913 RepID=UPI001314A150|nr:sucrase ferredoxin [Nocardioides mangrovicus]
MSGSFRCSLAAQERGDQTIGTATHVRAFLLVEHPGPWGQSALRDTALPGNLLAALRRRSSSAKVRILLTRRHQQRGQEGVRVWAACTDPVRPWLETTVLEDHHEVLDLDLEALGRGDTPGLAAHTEPVFGVCTHGRHDACCAERGRPVARALTKAYPDHTWEVSHLGGDRWAGNMLVLPHGLGYGWTDPESAVAVAEAHLAGRMTPDRLRGRAGYPMSVQFAEFAVREELGEWGLDALRPARPWEQVEGRWRAWFETPGGLTWEVEVVRTTDDLAAYLTCSARAENPVPRFQVAAMRPLP